jgi:hypothetical protein
LKFQVGALQQAENFLRNRNWVIQSSTNLRETLAYVIQMRPQYIIISCDHPNRKVKSLPKLLMQALPIRVIGFSEKGSGASLRDLNEMGLEYNLYPPVSGPAIERMILRIRKEDEIRAKDQGRAHSPRSTGENSPDYITFKGDVQPSEEMAASFEQARAILNQMLGPAGGPEPEDGKNYFQKGAPGWEPQNPGDSKESPWGRIPDYVPPQTAGGSGFSTAQPGYSALDLNSALQQGSPFQSENPDAFPSGAPQGSRPYSDPASNPDSEGSDGSGPSQNSDDTDSQNSMGTLVSRRDPHQVPVMESEYVGRKGPKTYRMTRLERENGNSDSIIVKGTQLALEETVNLKNLEKAAKVEKATHIACITIASARFSGYLVCAMGKNRTMDQNLMSIIQKRLFGFLKASGENVKEEDNLSLQIQEVDFTDWALEQAEFLRKSVHDGDEIAMAFFPSKSLEVNLEDSASEKMVKLNMSELKDDVAVEFDLYIFMPENNKYLLYTPKGKPLHGQQKSRLADKGVTHMHLRREAAHNVKKYRAQNFLNEKINAYKDSAKTAKQKVEKT